MGIIELLGHSSKNKLLPQTLGEEPFIEQIPASAVKLTETHLDWTGLSYWYYLFPYTALGPNGGLVLGHSYPSEEVERPSVCVHGLQKYSHLNGLIYQHSRHFNSLVTLLAALRLVSQHLSFIVF